MYIKKLMRSFKKLLSSLVEFSMLYGAEIWGCFQNLEALEQIQLRAFLDVGPMRPRVSLLIKVGDLPVVWLVTLHCTLFWVKVLLSKVYDGRLLRRVAVEAVKYGKLGELDKEDVWLWQGVWLAGGGC